MGDFNTTCALTHKNIKYDDDIVIVLLSKSHLSTSGMENYVWGSYSPINLLFSGKWRSGIDDIAVYENYGVDHATKQAMNDHMISYFNDHTVGGSFESKVCCSDLKLVPHGVKILDTNEVKEPTDEQLSMLTESERQTIRMINKMLMKSNRPQDMEFMIISADVFKELTLQFGMFKTSEYVDLYADQFQEIKRQPDTLEFSHEIQEYSGKGHSYAGQNRPVTDTVKIFKDLDKDLQMMRVYRNNLCDFAILYSFLSSIGKTFTPNMTVSECIFDYGYAEAHMVLNNIRNTIIAEEIKIED